MEALSFIPSYLLALPSLYPASLFLPGPHHYVLKFYLLTSFLPLENKYNEGSDWYLFSAIFSRPRIVLGPYWMLSKYMERRKLGGRKREKEKKV